MSARLPPFTGSANRLAPDFAAVLAAAQDLETQFLVSVADFLFSPWATFWGCRGVGVYSGFPGWQAAHPLVFWKALPRSHSHGQLDLP